MWLLFGERSAFGGVWGVGGRVGHVAGEGGRVGPKQSAAEWVVGVLRAWGGEGGGGGRQCAVRGSVQSLEEEGEKEEEEEEARGGGARRVCVRRGGEYGGGWERWLGGVVTRSASESGAERERDAMTRNWCVLSADREERRRWQKRGRWW